MLFEAGLARGEGGLAPALLIAERRKGDYAFLSLKAPAFDLTDRGVAGRDAPAGLDAFVYTERGVYRSGETVQVTALLRDGQGIASPRRAADARGRAARRRRIPPHRGAGPGLGGRSLSVPLISSAPTGTWRVRAFTDPKGRRSARPPSWSRTMCPTGSNSISRHDGEDLAGGAGEDHGRRPLPLRRAGLGPRLEGEMMVAR